MKKKQEQEDFDLVYLLSSSDRSSNLIKMLVTNYGTTEQKLLDELDIRFADLGQNKTKLNLHVLPV